MEGNSDWRQCLLSCWPQMLEDEFPSTLHADDSIDSFLTELKTYFAASWLYGALVAAYNYVVLLFITSITINVYYYCVFII